MIPSHLLRVFCFAIGFLRRQGSKKQSAFVIDVAECGTIPRVVIGIGIAVGVMSPKSGLFRQESVF